MLTLQDGASRVEIVPERGGLVTRFRVGDRPVLHLDEATLADPTKNVRGGVPVLFPSPGPLELRDDDATRAQFPWRFALAYRYALDGARLRIEQHIENRDAAPMPYAAGFHPYFFVRDADKSRARVPTTATRAWDNVQKREIALAGPIDLTQREVDLHLVDHGASEATLELGDGARVVVSGSEPYRRWVIWTLAGKDFVCLEPWTAPANALNTRDHLRVLAPGASDELFVEIALR
jgi:galactose mutarotase-like enzyme